MSDEPPVGIPVPRMKWFSTQQITLFEQVFQSLGGGRNGNLPLDKLSIMMRMCKASPTQDQLVQYQSDIDKAVFSFGDFLDVMSKHMETESKLEWNILLSKFFALHDPNGIGWAKISDLETMFCDFGDMTVTKDKFHELLEANGIRMQDDKISVVQFIQLFEHTME